MRRALGFGDVAARVLHLAAADGLLLLQQQREAWGLAQHSAAAALTAS
jgi:hypothetical protein